MKKIVCFMLVFCMLFTMMSGCGKTDTESETTAAKPTESLSEESETTEHSAKESETTEHSAKESETTEKLDSSETFDITNADLSEYIKLGDISEFSYDALVAEYEAYREELSRDMTSCNLVEGYTIDFSVQAELIDQNGAVTETVSEWTKDLVEGYDVARTVSDFDYFLICEDTATSYKFRTVQVGVPFSFVMSIAEEYENAALAGKTVKFTVDIKRILPAVYTDSYITERLMSFYNTVYTEKDVVEEGDTITMDFSGRVGSVRFDGGTAENYSIVVGEGRLIPGFEEQLIGHKLDETFDITVTFPEDYAVDATLAGKEAVFTITVKSISNDIALIENNTPFTTMWELKYALRVESYIELALMDYVQKNTTLIGYPEQLLENLEVIFQSYVDREIEQTVLQYAQYGQTYSKEEVKEMIYPDGTDREYIKESAKKAAVDYMVAVAVLRELGMEYTDEQYEKDLGELAADWTEYYGKTQKPADIEKFYGEEILCIAFIETLLTEELLKRITDAPVIPG